MRVTSRRAFNRPITPVSNPTPNRLLAQVAALWAALLTAAHRPAILMK